MPWAVGHYIFGLFIFKGGQINLYPKASYCPPWSATHLRNPHLVWMLWTSSTLSIWTVSSQRGWTSWRFPRKPWGSLMPMLPSTSAPLLQVATPSISSTVCIIIPFNVIGHSWSLGVLCPSLWSPWSPGLHFLFYHSLNDGIVTFLHGFSQVLLPVWVSEPSWMGLLSQIQHFLPCKGEPLVPGVSTKEQDGLPWRQDHAFSYLVFQPGLQEYVGDQISSHAWDAGGWLPPPSPALLSSEYNSAFCPWG